MLHKAPVGPVTIEQSGGPDVLVDSELAPLFEEVSSLTRGGGQYVAEPQFVALALGGIRSSAKSAEQLAKLADELTKGSELAAASASGAPIVVYNRHALHVGITAPNQPLVVMPGDSELPTLKAQIDCQSTAKWTLFQGEELERWSPKEVSNDISLSAPERMLTGGVGKISAGELEQSIFRDGVVAIGDVAVNGFLASRIRTELVHTMANQQRFRDSTALLALAAFREQNYSLPVSDADFVHRAGSKAVAALIAGSADVSQIGSDMSGGYEGEGGDRIAERLIGIRFTPDDHVRITKDILRAMRTTGITGLKRLADVNGGNLAEFAAQQAAAYMTYILNVPGFSQQPSRE